MQAPTPWWAYGAQRCAVPGCTHILTGTYDLLAHQREHDRQDKEKETDDQ